MSKKVLIIRSATIRKDSHLNRDTKTICDSIVNCGLVLLPEDYTYEFGEIDGVIWDKQEEKKEQIDEEPKVFSMKDIDKFAETLRYYNTDNDLYKKGVNDTIDNILFLLSHSLQEVSNENLRDSEN